jgi:hypothetical protein
MVENHEDYYQGCVMQMIQRWRKRLGEGLSAQDSVNLKGSAIDITMSLGVGDVLGQRVLRQQVGSALPLAPPLLAQLQHNDLS